MSKQTSERWQCRGDYITVGPGEGTAIAEVVIFDGDASEGEALLADIIDDHNACLYIEDPETTVSELVAACKAVVRAHAQLIQEYDPRAAIQHVDTLDQLAEKCGAVLAKTGKK